MKRGLLVFIVLLCASSWLFAAGGVKQKRPRAYDYGRVVINNFSTAAGMSPVAFDHWTHRSRYTCRVCHVDLAIEMLANATEITAADNQQGYYCGACHNGTSRFDGTVIFAACDPGRKKQDRASCERCHMSVKDPQRKKDFYTLAKTLPADRFGNKIDWDLAESEGLIKPLRYVKGISVEHAAMPVQDDFALNAKLEGIPDIIFSHRKHTVWNGCETCHPDIFVGVKKGVTKYSMVEIFAGKYCGVCHGSVAFPLQECQRCHTEQPQ